MTEPDYDLLLDAQTKAFITRTLSYSPDRGAPPTVAEMRADYDAMCAGFAAPLPEGLTITDAQIANGSHAIPVRWYQPEGKPESAPVMIYFHGGGFVVGGLDSHHSIVADLAHQAGITVMAVDYALAPEAPYPAALEDAMSAVRHIANTTENSGFILAGDSAGAWLAASVAHALARPEPRLLGQLLIYPTLGGDISTGSYVTHAHTPMLSTDDIIWYGQQFMGRDQIYRRVGPLCEADFTNLPPTVIFAAACDPLYDDGPAYAELITAAGGKAKCWSEEGLVHGYLRGRYEVQKIADSFARIVAGCRALTAGSWPYSQDARPE